MEDDQEFSAERMVRWHRVASLPMFHREICLEGKHTVPYVPYWNLGSAFALMSGKPCSWAALKPAFFQAPARSLWGPDLTVFDDILMASAWISCFSQLYRTAFDLVLQSILSCQVVLVGQRLMYESGHH